MQADRRQNEAGMTMPTTGITVRHSNSTPCPGNIMTDKNLAIPPRNGKDRIVPVFCPSPHLPSSPSPHLSIRNSKEAVSRHSTCLIQPLFIASSGCLSAYSNVRFPSCTAGLTMISRCLAPVVTFMATPAISCGVSVLNTGVAAASSSGESSFPVSA